MTELEVIALGFKEVKKYMCGDFNEWTVHRYKKGVIEVEFTYHTSTQRLETVDATLDEVVGLHIVLSDLQVLDKILNTNAA